MIVPEVSPVPVASAFYLVLKPANVVTGKCVVELPVMPSVRLPVIVQTVRAAILDYATPRVRYAVMF